MIKICDILNKTIPKRMSNGFKRDFKGSILTFLPS